MFYFDVLSNSKSIVFYGICLDYEDMTKSDTTDTPKTKESDMSDLDSKEIAAQRKNEQRKDLKILTPNQILSRLSVSSAQLKGGNNSEKLKNEIRQLLYYLYRSKIFTKQL